VNHHDSETHHDDVRSTAVDGNSIADKLAAIVDTLVDLPACYRSEEWRKTSGDRVAIDDAIVRCLHELDRAVAAARRIGDELIGGGQ
jgi:hypothetical protein